MLMKVSQNRLEHRHVKKSIFFLALEYQHLKDGGTYSRKKHEGEQRK
jgi:hypothetical protein